MLLKVVSFTNTFARSSSPSLLCVCVSDFWRATAGLINTTKAVMSAPLPKVYEDCGNGTAQPIATTQGLSGAIGGDFKVDELQRVSKETASSAIYAAALNILLMTSHLPFVTRTPLQQVGQCRQRSWRPRCWHLCKDGPQHTTQSRRV